MSEYRNKAVWMIGSIGKQEIKKEFEIPFQFMKSSLDQATEFGPGAVLPAVLLLSS